MSHIRYGLHHSLITVTFLIGILMTAVSCASVTKGDMYSNAAIQYNKDRTLYKGTAYYANSDIFNSFEKVQFDRVDTLEALIRAPITINPITYTSLEVIDEMLGTITESQVKANNEFIAWILVRYLDKEFERNDLPQIVGRLVAKGFDLDTPVSVVTLKKPDGSDYAANDKRSAYHLMYEFGLTGIQREVNTACYRLAEKNGDDFIDKDGNSLVHLAVLYDQDETLARLANSGKYINRKNTEGLTPLYMAVLVNKTWAAKTLLDKKAEYSLFAPVGDNFAIEIRALLNGNEELFKMLVDNTTYDYARLKAWVHSFIHGLKEIIREKDAELVAKRNQLQQMEQELAFRKAEGKNRYSLGFSHDDAYAEYNATVQLYNYHANAYNATLEEKKAAEANRDFMEGKVLPFVMIRELAAGME